jgi:hypothetical protein
MSYIINNSRGQIVAVVGDGTVNTTATDLALVGRAVTNYGEYQNENYVYLLENFANGAAPVQPILGQLWYNSTTDIISAYNTANTWVALASENYVEAAKISPVFTGVPIAPTAPGGTANTQIATTAFVTNSPQFAGVPTAPTAPAATNSTWIATTAFVQNNKASPVFTGTPIAPTPSYNNNTQQIATTAFVQGEKVSPAFTGVPTAPTAPAATDTTQIATTAFVTNSPQFAGVPTAPTAPNGTSNAQIATTAFVTAGPSFTDAPTAPTAALGTATTQLATTAYVVNAISPGGLLGTMAQQNADNVNIVGGAILNLDTPLPVIIGGTGGNNAADARNNLGLASGATTTVGTMAVQNANNVTISGGNIAGLVNPIAIASGGTGGNTAASARTSLGLGSIATQSATNVNLQGVISVTGGAIGALDVPIPLSAGGTGGNTAAAARGSLGLQSGATTTVGTMATQNSNSVSITGGSITGITPLLITAGGTGGNTALQARQNLAAAWTDTNINTTGGLTGGGNLNADRTISIATDSNGYGTRYVSSANPTGGVDGDIWYQI